jgi:uncharacterized protein involved in cysteine biosynthesis
MLTRQAIGFWRGFTAPFGAAANLLGKPSAWPLALVPPLVFLLLELVFVGFAWKYLLPLTRSKLSNVDSLPAWGQSVASWGVVGVALVLGWFMGLALAPVLSAPALERLVGITEAELGAPERPPLGFLAELFCGLRATLLGLVLSVPVVLALTLLEVVVPPVAVVATPLKILVGALGVSWGLFDYPLTLRGIRARERFAFMTRHWSVVLGFGLAFTALFLVPCFGLLMLPVGVIAATRLFWEIQRAAAQ